MTGELGYLISAGLIVGPYVRYWTPRKIASTVKSAFCLTVLEDGSLEVKQNYKYYTQVQDELTVINKERAHSVVWTRASEDNIRVERIFTNRSF